MKTNEEYAVMLRKIEDCKEIVLKVIALPEDAALVVFDFEGGVVGTTSAVIYEDGTIFTMRDWQDPSYPESFEEIKDFDWREGVTDHEAIMIDGLPRLGLTR